jgi:hypothetical protein
VTWGIARQLDSVADESSVPPLLEPPGMGHGEAAVATSHGRHIAPGGWLHGRVSTAIRPSRGQKG